MSSPSAPAAPLVSMLLMTYNQQHYVLAALQGALQQTYSPLEIVISDDASSDATFQTIQDAIKDYRGPHRIVLNRNPQNLGIGAHFNRLVELAHGELLFVAAGDDISLPERCQRVVDAWQTTDRRVDLIATAMMDMDSDGKDHGRIEVDDLAAYRNAQDWQARPPYLVGAAHAWTPRLFERFGPLPGAMVAEDQVMVLRAILAGGAITLNEPLVRYRRGGVSSRQLRLSAADVGARLLKHSRHASAEFAQMLADAERARQLDAVASTLNARLARETFIRDIFSATDRGEQLKLVGRSRLVPLSVRLRMLVYAAFPAVLAPFFWLKRLFKRR